MKTQNRNMIIFVAAAAVIMTMTVNLSGQEAGRENVPALSDEFENFENMEYQNVEEQKDRDYCRHEFSFWGAGGFSTFNATPNFGDRNYRLGGALGLGYSFHFSKHLSILAGAEIAMYNTRMLVDKLQDQIETYDPDGNPIKYNVSLKHYVEKDRLYALNIPLMLQFQTNFNDSEHAFFIALGAKAGLPLSMKYEMKEAEFRTYGEYIEYGQWLYRQGDLGYGNQDVDINSEKFKTKLSWIGTAEIGVKWNLRAPRLHLYTGLYFDYGFNEIRKEESDKRFLEYDKDNPYDMTLNSVLSSEYSHKGTDLKKFTDKVSTLSFGLKLRLGINTCPGERSYKNRNKYYDEEPDYYYNDDESIDPYREGYRDAYKDVIDGIINSLNPPKRKAEPVDVDEEEPNQTKAPAQTKKAVEPYYYGDDPLIQAEMRRASKEYGKLANLFVLYIDGYEINQTELSPIMEMMIDDKLPLLEEYNNDNYIIICEGHTCDLADENYNKNLAQKRAEVVKEYLIKNGFKGENIMPVSKGKSTPIVYNTSEQNRKLNRRVVFLIKEKK